MRPLKTSASIVGFVLSLRIAPIHAHTWVEQVLRIKDSQLVGPIGYPRAHVPRNDPTFSDVRAQNKVVIGGDAPLPDDIKMCKPEQTMESYTDEFPMLKANPGDWVSLGFAENGHTTLKTDFKPANGGTVFIYGTMEPLPPNEEKLNNIHLVWNAAGTGGDGRGRLLATSNFDNGVCHENNSGPESTKRKQETGLDTLLCQADVQLPDDISEGTYTLYWVWDWPNLKEGVDNLSATGTEDLDTRGATEMYTSCIDLEITTTKLKKENNPVNPPDSMANEADASQMSTRFQVTKNIASLISTDGQDDENLEPPNQPDMETPTTVIQDQPATTEEVNSPFTSDFISSGASPSTLPPMSPSFVIITRSITNTVFQSITTIPPTETHSGGIVTETDIVFVTISEPKVITQTISIGDSTTMTLPVVVATGETTMKTERRFSSEVVEPTGKIGRDSYREEKNEKTTTTTETTIVTATQESNGAVEPTQFMPTGAKFRRR